ncbi:MAG: sulfurtransferase TusA family protein [Bacteroides sp.]|nr:sulfurtransferase TusA family protein [Bacteroides sp.]
MSGLTYRLPDTLSGDITKFASLAKGYEEKQVSATEFKAFRVPMGVYEQRKNEVYMARVRATGGVIYPAQLQRLIDIARRHGSNLLHLTTRQEIQIQNLSLDEVEAVLRELQEAGLATKGGGGNTVRNIMVSELSGLSADEAFDTTPYALELTSRMIAEPDSYLLPRKMKIAFSSDEHNIDYAGINDVGLVAKLKDGKRGFFVYVGGGAGSKPTTGWKLFDFLPAEDLYTLVKALKNFFSAHGNRKNRNQARIRFIFYKRGEEETLRLIREYFEEEKKKAVVIEVEDPVNERPAYVYQPQAAPEADAAYELWKKRYVVRQRQQGYVSVLFPVILGNIWLEEERVARLEKLLALLQVFGEHTIRFTNTQNIRLRNLPEEALPEVYALLKDFKAETGVPVIVNNIVSCTGADTCRLGIGLSKGLAAAIRKELLQSNLDLDRLSGVSIHVTGCPNSCGQQLWADLGFAGRALRNERTYPGYQVFLAAERKTEPKLAEAVGSLSARDVPKFVRRLLEDYQSVGDGRSFTDYLKAEGREKALQLLAEYKHIPSFADDKNYYFDWGAEEIFSVTPQGKAECSAGLFDMIKVDLDTIAYNKKQLETETDAVRKNRLIYEVIYSASRMLLVTRGLDPRSVEETFDFFIDNFIAAGYVDVRYKSLVLTARNDRQADFRPLQQDAYALADAVTELYNGMDDSLQFKKPAPVKEASTDDASAQEAEATTPEKPRRVKDLRGVICPMNFVKTKLELAAIQSGDLLEIWLDDGQPIDNVPGSVKLEGHTIVEQEPVEDYWKVIIKKK